MVDRTDRHFRAMMRAITKRVLLYTEMISVNAALGHDRERVLGFDPAEGPVALQLGGDEPARLAEACRVAEAMGYDEVDLNCGCPSSRVQQGRMGVVLMKTPDTVARCVEAMRVATTLPVTVKHRLGVDDLDSYDHVATFVRRVASAGADRLIIHARKAWLNGLSPKENRTIPPLRYDWVHRLKREHPGVAIEINGGIVDLDEAAAHLRGGIDGVMIGRAAYDDPMLFAGADAWLAAGAQGGPYPSVPSPDTATRIAMLHQLKGCIERGLVGGFRLSAITRPMMGIVHGVPGARRFRQCLAEGSRDRSAGLDVFEAALDVLAEHTGAAAPRLSAAPTASGSSLSP